MDLDSGVTLASGRAPARGHNGKLAEVIRDQSLIAGLADDDPYKVDRIAALQLLEQLQYTAVINRTLHTNIGPYDWQDWPNELIDTIIEWANSQTET